MSNCGKSEDIEETIAATTPETSIVQTAPKALIVETIPETSEQTEETTEATEVSTEPSTETEPKEEMVWISGSGSKYHRKSSCSNMTSPKQVTKSNAKARGLSACKRCY